VDGVIDSSRYYAVRIKDPKSNRTTNIGIGFRDREQAFDFKNCLNEYIRYVDRNNLASKLTLLSHGEDAGDLSNSVPSPKNNQSQSHEQSFHFGNDPNEEFNNANRKDDVSHYYFTCL
jgi:hypothetical protein